MWGELFKEKATAFSAFIGFTVSTALPVPLIATDVLTCFILRCHGSCNMAPYSKMDSTEKNSANTFWFDKTDAATFLRR